MALEQPYTDSRYEQLLLDVMLYSLILGPVAVLAGLFFGESPLGWLFIYIAVGFSAIILGGIIYREVKFEPKRQ